MTAYIDPMRWLHRLHRCLTVRRREPNQRYDEIIRSHEARRRVVTKANEDLCGVNGFWG
jgi:hypothetical protein